MAPKGEDGSWLRDGAQGEKGEISGRMGSGGDWNGCFPRGRKVYSDSANLTGAPFARLGATQDAEGVTSKVLGAICCCSGYGGASDLKPKPETAESGRWDDVEASSWKQWARRAKAHVHTRPAPHPSRDDWLSYDPHSYQMNFDDGCPREDSASSLHIDENDDPASRERAMQSALLKKFAASRAQRAAT